MFKRDFLLLQRQFVSPSRPSPSTPTEEPAGHGRCRSPASWLLEQPAVPWPGYSGRAPRSHAPPAPIFKLRQGLTVRPRSVPAFRLRPGPIFRLYSGPIFKFRPLPIFRLCQGPTFRPSRPNIQTLLWHNIQICPGPIFSLCQNPIFKLRSDPKNRTALRPNI